MKFLVQRDLCGRGFLFGLVLSAALWISTSFGSAQTLADGLDTTNLVWTTGGNSVWFVQTTNTHDGIDAVRHGNVVSNEISWIETTVVGPATVRYWIKAATVNYRPQVQLRISREPQEGGVLPEIRVFLTPFEWSEQILDLEAGTNRLRWTVSNSGNNGTSGFIALDQVSVGPPRPPTITYQPTDTTNYAGATTYFSSYASGGPPISYQWRKDGVNIAGATNADFRREATTTNDAGVYSVVASNALGFAVSSNAVLAVLPPTAPFVTYEPMGMTTYVGETAYVFANVDGSPPFIFYWRKDGANLPSATSTSLWGSATLTLEDVSLADAGNYTLFVTNDYGSVESAVATVVVAPPLAPVILRQPRSLEVAEGVNTWLSVQTTGAPAPCHLWARLEFPPVPPPPIMPCQQPVREFNNVTTNEAGIYFATVKNNAGTNVSRDALLTVLPPISPAGSWPGGAYDLFVTNGLAYLARGTNGLAILSVSNLASPQLLGTFSTTGFVGNVTVANGMAFLGNDSGLQIVSVTNPFNPVVVGSYAMPYYASDVAVRGNLAFVANSSAGLLILNVANPALPALVGNYRTNFYAARVSLSGNHAFVSAPFWGVIGPGPQVSGLFIVDISDPAHPFEVGRHPAELERMVVRDQIIFGIRGTSLTAISLTNPAQPMVIGSHYFSLPFPRFGAPPSDVFVMNDLAYVVGHRESENESEVFVLNVRDPSEPIRVGGFTNLGKAHAIGVEGNAVFFAGVDTPLKIIQTPFNVAPVAAPRLSVSATAGLTLGLQGRRGLHYDIEFAGSLANPQWQRLQTVLLTNDAVSLPVAAGDGSRFFRLKQLD